MTGFWKPFTVACGLVLALAIAPVTGASAQQAGQTAQDPQAALMADVLAALPAGVTLADATEDQIAAAIQSVISTQSAAGTALGQTVDVAAVASQVISVVSVSLDAMGRGSVATTVTAKAVSALPTSVQTQVSQSVSTSRANPPPTLVAVAVQVVSGTLAPAAGGGNQGGGNQGGGNQGGNQGSGFGNTGGGNQGGSAT